MSYRLVDSNELALVIPEVNMMPCIYADLPNGLDYEHYELSSRPKGHWIYLRSDMYECSECGKIYTSFEIDECDADYCPKCGAKMVEPQERSDKE